MRKVKFWKLKRKQEPLFCINGCDSYFICFNWISALQGFPASLQTKRGTNEILLQQLEKKLDLLDRYSCRRASGGHAHLLSTSFQVAVHLVHHHHHLLLLLLLLHHHQEVHRRGVSCLEGAFYPESEKPGLLWSQKQQQQETCVKLGITQCSPMQV